MITRPLDLSSRLRPQPRSADWLFFVNAGLLVLFFVLFGSRFVLSPGIGVDFVLPEVPGTSTDLRATTHVIKVENAGQIMVDDGFRNMEQLQEWLNAEAKTEKHPALLVQASAAVPTAISARIVGMAQSAGFSVVLAAQSPAPQENAPEPR